MQRLLLARSALAVCRWVKLASCGSNWLVGLGIFAIASSCQAVPSDSSDTPGNPGNLPSSETGSIEAASSPTTLTPPIPPPPPANAYLAQIHPDAANQLTTLGVALGIEIVIPTNLPPGMTLVN